MRQDVGSEKSPALEESGLNMYSRRMPADLADATLGTKRRLGLYCVERVALSVV